MQYYVEICQSELAHLPMDELKKYYYIHPYLLDKSKSHIICEDCVELFKDNLIKSINNVVKRYFFDVIPDSNAYKMELRNSYKTRVPIDPMFTKFGLPDYITIELSIYHDLEIKYNTNLTKLESSLSNIEPQEKTVRYALVTIDLSPDVDLSNDCIGLTVGEDTLYHNRITFTLDEDLGLYGMDSIIDAHYISMIEEIPEDEVLRIMKGVIDGNIVLDEDKQEDSTTDEAYACHTCNKNVENEHEYFIYQNNKYCVDCMYAIAINKAASVVGGLDDLGIGDDISRTFTAYNTSTDYKVGIITRASTLFKLGIVYVVDLKN